LTIVPPNGILITEDAIATGVTTLKSGENFLKYQGTVNHYHRGVDQQPVLCIFTTKKMLKVLAEGTQICADGAHKCPPSIYKSYSKSAQLFTLGVMINHRLIPCLYSLLPGATEAMYQLLLTEIKKLIIQEFGRDYYNRPETLRWMEVMLDFETSPRSAFTAQVLSGCNGRLIGCFFHFCQCVIKKLRESSFLLSLYRSDVKMKMLIRTLMSLAFLPSSNVAEAYDEIMTAAVSENVGGWTTNASAVSYKI
jgi:hypothetical protein